MKLKELLTVVDSSVYLNIVSEGGSWWYDGKVNCIKPTILERTIKLVDIIGNELFITVED